MRAGAGRGFVGLLAAYLGVLAVVPLPDDGIWLRFRTFLLAAVGTVLACWAFLAGDWPEGRTRWAWRSGPNPAILVFLAWIGLSVVLSPFPEHSHYEAMRCVGGALLYFAVAYGLPGREAHRLAGVICGVLAAGSLVAFILTGNRGSGRISGAFLDEQLLAAFLCVLFPVAVAAIRTDQGMVRRLLALAASVLGLMGLVVTRNRSTWAGAVVALIVLGALYVQFGLSRRSSRVRWQDGLLFALVAVLSVGIFLAFSNYGDSVARRFGSLSALSQDVSVGWRFDSWRAALELAREHPVLGVGVGTFALNQQRFVTGVGEQKTVFEQGSTLWENAHNSYLQIAAEIGFVGLALYLAIFAAFFVTAVRSLKLLPRGSRRVLVMGSIAAVAAQMVSAVGNPAWEYAECSTFLWLVMGLGMAAGGLGERGTGTELPKSRRSRRRRRRSRAPEGFLPDDQLG